MFIPPSRYAGTGTYQVTAADGTVVTVARLPLPQPRAVRGWYRRTGDERLDLLAHTFAADATAAWELGWTNGAMSLDALAAHELIAVPDRS
ncbi:hypothetical protein Cs7R123_48350 [Catellatospora sp. TT07R-123]|uniref:hypothetical protein n=1 Tax=Catellatospora sp. TT07R-123 TaxID=2733863 RepID=UPI001B2711B0|nr:hypothetical protein [Catellatospora sp. TT07R-123]GHJ47493.1 hypothetical protein Cs7R123_48350 [Catellatospora sp. TT07R-123]